MSNTKKMTVKEAYKLLDSASGEIYDQVFYDDRPYEFDKQDYEALCMAVDALKDKCGSNDLISRQLAIDALGDIHPLDYNAQTYKARIEKLPSAQPDEVFFVKTNQILSFDDLKKLKESLTSQCKNIVLLPEDCTLLYPKRKGKWIKTIKHYDGDDMEFDYYAIKCSICGLPPEKAYHLTDYCPNCGADLRGDTE